MGAAALGAAALWAATNLLLRGQVTKLGGAAANAWCTDFSILCFASIFLAARQPRDLLGGLPQTPVVLLASVLLSMVLGDILQLIAIRRLGIVLAMPISASSPLLTLLIAALLLAGRPPRGRPAARCWTSSGLPWQRCRAGRSTTRGVGAGRAGR